ncbi:MAG: NAD(+)--dinitrogen-reductase ADP-D-ribosyltransferase [Burkholderiaceae bacterium]|nr:NAD(+)--dinitrogen-reductase ADP-D-ribosyltransferase [Burkholderiaceae bacterium]
MTDEVHPHPSYWYTTNLVGIPAAIIGSAAFNAHPQTLHVAGARESNRGLFSLLDRCNAADEARAVFEHYMSVVFGLARPEPDATGEGGTAERRRWRSSYLKLLQGWGLDANSPSGAVLKGWVESRFGLVPSFHGGTLVRFPSPVWMSYLEQKSSSRYHNNSIYQQLDLLFEFCQWMLKRFELLGPEPLVTLWRGSLNFEQQIVSGSLRDRHCTVNLNNLVSFTLERETAGCFGDWVMRVQVPKKKLLLIPGLLNTTSLRGESEVLAIGGDYEVEVSYGP